MDTVESKPHKLTLTWETAKDTRTETFEFPFRPTEAELGLKLAAFFGIDNFRFNEGLQEVHECVLVEPHTHVRQAS
ncbi:hypothetical protein KDW49_22055 [Burkholderia dolosa]|uniref:hypothetical protein n=1 Tax=Burkholderia dolosa TaxID=152500 RepID=UPI001BA233C1|nr:hypothetical protein [Burkholderia dolosa]MBR8303394.1 hypothetical protein [Burkholderia dolosa]